ncbi:MAG: hypothetical protein WCB86_07255 [Candidatus Dormiibacterota bacterium]
MEPAPRTAHEPPERTTGVKVGSAVGTAVDVGVGVAVALPLGVLLGVGVVVDGVTEGVGVAPAVWVVALRPGSAWLTSAATTNIAPAAPMTARLVQRRRSSRPSSRVFGEGGM